MNSSRRYACAARRPATFSWNSALTREIRSRDTEYAVLETRRKTTVAIVNGTSAASATRARVASVTSSATAIPTRVNSDTTAVDRPVWMNDDSASTSVVIRVMIRPDSSRS